MTGEITTANTFGYLNAEQYPLLAFYIWTTIGYLIVGIVWALLCLKHRSQLIQLHHFLSVILGFQIVQAIFMVIEYEIQNSYGTLVFSFTFMNILFSTVRNTFARVLTLLVAMGTGITSNVEAHRQKPKILVLSILYFVANVAYLIAVYINKTSPLTPNVQLSVSLPLSMTNTMFFFWILRSLELTKKSLLEKRQNVKLEMMQKFTFILIGVYIIAVAAVFSEIYVKFSGERDELWRYEWMVESSWFIIFTLFVIAVMVLMRPTATSRLLAQVEELCESDQAAS